MNTLLIVLRPYIIFATLFSIILTTIDYIWLFGNEFEPYPLSALLELIGLRFIVPLAITSVLHPLVFVFVRRRKIVANTVVIFLALTLFLAYILAYISI